MHNWDSMALDVGQMSSQVPRGVKDNLIFSFTSDTEIGNWRKYPLLPCQSPKDQHIYKHILQT